LKGSLWARAGLWWSEADRWVTRLQGVSRGAADGFFGAALRPEEKAALGRALYDRTPFFQGEGLQGWEARWLEARLPPAPARVLVGGAGAGRELLWLCARGYTLGALEPSPRLAGLARERLGAGAQLWEGDYEGWSGLTLEGVGDGPAWLCGPWDAVLLGWGSLTHVVSPAAQRRALEAAARCCPQGPILLSAWVEGHPGAPRLWRGAAHRAAARLGEAVGARRGAPPRGRGERFVLGLGSGWTFTRAEVEALGESIGRRVCWEGDPDTYAHATLLPPPPPPAGVSTPATPSTVVEGGVGVDDAFGVRLPLLVSAVERA
jgi:hypothetical protein